MSSAVLMQGVQAPGRTHHLEAQGGEPPWGHPAGPAQVETAEAAAVPGGKWGELKMG